MSVAPSAPPAPADRSASPRPELGRSRFADLLAAARSARTGGRAGPGAQLHPGGAPGSLPAAPARSGKRPPGEPASELRGGDPSCAAPPTALAPPASARDPPGPAELQACVRAAPPVIVAGLRQGGAELALTFGAALSLDVRSGAQGLELTLRPASGLERATRAELPGLLDALRARGLRVSRAEVRSRAPTPIPRRAR